MCSRSSWSARQCRFLRLMRTPSSVRAVSIAQDASDRTALWSSTIAAGSAAYASADIARSKLEGSRNTTGSGGRLPNTGALQPRSRNDRAWTVLKRLPRSCTARVQNASQSTGRNALSLRRWRRWVPAPPRAWSIHLQAGSPESRRK